MSAGRRGPSRRALLALAAGLGAASWRAGRAEASADVTATPAAGPAPMDRGRTLFIVGDSTVRSAGRHGQWGWGERLAPWFDPGEVTVANHAMAGRSSRSFLREGRWAELRSLLKPGDAVLIQFGHNDLGRVGDPAAKQRGALPGLGDETVEEALPDGGVEQVRSFGAYLTAYLRDARAAGAVPVVVSPVPHRDRWRDDVDFADIGAWGREVARREGGWFIDLTGAVTEAYRALGQAEVDRLFADANTHTNEAGATLNAECVARLLGALPDAAGVPRPRARPRA